MNKWTLLSMFITLVLVSACARTPVSVEKAPFELMQEHADAMSAAGGFSVVGIGSAMTPSTAMDKARSRGRRDMKHLVLDRIESLKNNFSNEFAGLDTSELDVFFDAVARQVELQELRALKPTRVHQDTHNGLVTVWALHVLDPVVIRDAIFGQTGNVRQLLSNLKASRCFSELEAQIESYQAFALQHMRTDDNR